MKDRNVKQLLAVIEVLREVKVDMPIQQLQAFLVIVREDGLSLQDIQRRTGQPVSSNTRNVRILTDRATATRKGYGLVYMETDPVDYRQKIARLTDKGKVLAARLDEVMGCFGKD